MKNKIYILLLIFILIFISIKSLIRLNLKDYINNNIKYDNINIITNINLSISSKTEKSNITYRYQKSNNVYKINYDQYKDDKHSLNIEKYYIKNKDIYEYTYVNDKWNKKKVKSIEKIFNINYEKLKKSIKTASYKGIVDNKYKKYTAKIKVYNAYNFIYNKNILTSNDNNKYINMDIYIDKTNNFVYKIQCNIPDLGENITNYKLEIINTKINNNDTITLPFKK